MRINCTAIIVLGKRNSGKSSTWYELFGRKIRSGYKKLIPNNSETLVFLKNSSFEENKKKITIDVFLKNSSFEEMGESASEYFEERGTPKIVLCSVQYNENGRDTINWFIQKRYYVYIQWLNPGFHSKGEYLDKLNFEERFSEFGEFHKVSGKEVIQRTNKIRNFLFDEALNCE